MGFHYKFKDALFPQLFVHAMYVAQDAIDLHNPSSSGDLLQGILLVPFRHRAQVQDLIHPNGACIKVKEGHSKFAARLTNH